MIGGLIGAHHRPMDRSFERFVVYVGSCERAGRAGYPYATPTTRFTAPTPPNSLSASCDALPSPCLCARVHSLTHPYLFVYLHCNSYIILAQAAIQTPPTPV